MGVPQIVMFNMTNITAHEPKTGAVTEDIHGAPASQCLSGRVASPSQAVTVWGQELLEIKKDAAGEGSAHRVRKTLKFRVKMSKTPVSRRLFLRPRRRHPAVTSDARHGSPRWKEGRYGHGQILLVGDLLLVTLRKTAKSSSLRPSRGAERTHPWPRFLHQDLEPPGTELRSAFDAH